MLLTTLAFTLFALPVGHGVGTVILEKVFHAPSRIASIRTIDEAVVIGAALSLSSSAFVLQLLSESGELPTKFGSATLGILLLQVSALSVALMQLIIDRITLLCIFRETMMIVLKLVFECLAHVNQLCN